MYWETLSTHGFQQKNFTFKSKNTKITWKSFHLGQILSQTLSKYTMLIGFMVIWTKIHFLNFVVLLLLIKPIVVFWICVKFNDDVKIYKF